MAKRTKKEQPSLIAHHYKDHPRKETRYLASTEEGRQIILNYFKNNRTKKETK